MTKRRNPHREARELGAMLRRMCRALERRADQGELEAVTELRAMRTQVDESIRNALRASVAFGYTYQAIADEVGVSRQAIHKVAGDVEPRPKPSPQEQQAQPSDQPAQPALELTTESPAGD